MTSVGNDRGGARRFTVRHSVSWALSTAGALFAVEAALDGLLIARSGAQLSSALASSALSGALTFVLVVALTPVFVAIAAVADRLGSRQHGTRWGLLLLVAVSAPITLAISEPTEHLSPIPYFAIAVAAALLIAAAGFLACAQPRTNGKVGALLLAASALALDVGVGAEAYPEVHGLAFVVLAAAVASLLCDATLRRRVEPSRPLFAWGGAALTVCILFAVATSLWAPEVYYLPVLHGRNGARAAGWLRAPFDRDGDGFAPVLWGGDCNDQNRAVHPGAPDPPGHGDQNCNGVDGAREVPAEFFATEPMGPPTLPPGSVDRVVMLTLDTLRHELFRDDIMPNLMSLVRRGALFRGAYAAATVTGNSVPLLHRAAMNDESIATALHRAGVATYAFAFTASDFEHRSVSRDDAQLAQLALEALEEPRSKPLFLWAHFIGLHYPYTTWPDALTPPPVPPLAPAYVSEAMHLDAALKPLLTWLNSPERLAKSVIVVTGDHGEAFGEHGAFYHSRLGWDEIVRTPIALVAPGLAPGDYPHLASHRDLPATVVGALGLDPASLGMERFGRSMLRIIGHEHVPLRRTAICHSSRQSSGALVRDPLGVLIDGKFKVVVGIYDGVPELYDLAADPHERTNLAPIAPALTARLLRKLAVYADAEAWPAVPPPKDWRRIIGLD